MHLHFTHNVRREKKKKATANMLEGGSCFTEQRPGLCLTFKAGQLSVRAAFFIAPLHRCYL